MIENLKRACLRSFFCASAAAFWASAAAFWASAAVLLALAASGAAEAERIKHSIAVFSGLDKITGRIIAFEVATDETVQFGSLQITERACYTRPATEAPQTTTFIEVDEVDGSNEYKRIFSGWMFAASPGLHAIEHPIYDVWLTDCKGGGEVVANPNPEAAVEPSAPAEASPAAPSRAPVAAPPSEPAKAPPKPKQRQRRAPPVDAAGEQPPPGEAQVPGGGPIEVGPPPGLIPPPAQQRRAPTQRFYPTAPGAAGDGYGESGGYNNSNGGY